MTTKLKETEMNEIQRKALTVSYQEIANEYGVSIITIKRLMKKLNHKEYRNEHFNKKIVEEFGLGYTKEELACRYSISKSSIDRIIRENSESGTSKSIKSDEFRIPKERWQWFLKNKNKDELFSMLSKKYNDYHIPKLKMSKTQILSTFNALKEYDTERLIKNGKCTFKNESRLKNVTNWYLEINSIGTKASDIFHQDARIEGHSIHAPSYYKMWTTKKLRDEYIHSIIRFGISKIDDENLKSTYSFLKYMPAQFKPAIAKFMYDHYKAKLILDQSFGWGDRYLGFCASNAKEYIGVDPNTKLRYGYNKQKSTYCFDKKSELITLPFEEYCPTKGYFDMAFTSPPYFDTERYSEEETQSWKRYKDIDSWLEKFLYVMIDKSIYALRKGGILAINIANPKHVDIISKMMKHTEQIKNITLECVIPMRINNRYANGGKVAEPIFVWKKK